MRFVFQCLVQPHSSGRVTVTPVDLPEMAVHAADVPSAVEELLLALDDRISRAHPRHLPAYARGTVAELRTLEVPVLRVAGADEDVVAPLRLHALEAPVQRPYTEVRVPALDVRFWLRDRDPAAAATELLEEHLASAVDAELLARRAEGAASLIALELEVTPLRLSDLRRKELHLDERPPPAPPEEAAGPGTAAAKAHDSHAEDDDDPDDDWDEPRSRRRARAARSQPKAPPTPTLRRIGLAWHELAAAGALEGAWERDALVEDLVLRVSAASPDPIVLVGPTGAGKTAILRELALRLAQREAEDGARPFYFVDASRLIAGEGFFGDWQRQVLDAWKEAQAARAVLCLGRVVDLLDAGKTAHSDQNVAQLLTAPLLGREVAVVAEATAEEWAEVERRNQGFARAFAVLRVDEPAPAETERILERLLGDLAKARGLKVAPGLIGEAISLCARFQPYGALVGNAAALLRRLVDTRAHARATRLSAGDLTQLFSEESGIPLLLLRDDLPLDEDEVRAFLEARVHGQAAATARAARVVSVIKANLSDRARPAAVLLFAGPTGVGKTELAKALAELCFGSRDRLVRLDMGEYAGPDALWRLLGDPSSPGQLTQAVRQQPFSLVLLDEIEKAHPAVFDALLGLLGEGRLTDASGRLVDFRATVVVMTSNLGADTLRERPGFATGAGEAAAAARVAHYVGEARRFFRPELFNRLDDIVVFSPLGPPQIGSIVERELRRVGDREGLRRRDVTLVVEPAARDWLAQVGLDPRYGARPLKRAIERHLVAPIAAWLGEHPPAGPVRLVASLADGGRELALSAETPPQPQDGAADAVLSRAALQRILERSAEVRAQVRRFSRSSAMVELRQRLALFDCASQKPGFWQERALADEAARAAAEARELDRGFVRAEEQAEAAEDLAYEAWYARQGAAAATLGAELDAVLAALAELRVRLLASLFPPRSRVALELVPGQGAWRELCSHAQACARALERRGAQVETFALVEREVGDAAAPQDGPRAGGGKKKRAGSAGAGGARRAGAKGVERQWRADALDPDAQPPGRAALLVASGTPAIMLLAAEHGTHRFTSVGDSQLVRARFEPRPPSSQALAQLGDLEALEKRAPAEEIRRILVDRRLVRDLRTGTEVAFGGEGLELTELHEAYLAWRVLGGGGQ